MRVVTLVVARASGVPFRRVGSPPPNAHTVTSVGCSGWLVADTSPGGTKCITCGYSGYVDATLPDTWELMSEDTFEEEATEIIRNLSVPVKESA